MGESVKRRRGFGEASVEEAEVERRPIAVAPNAAATTSGAAPQELLRGLRISSSAEVDDFLRAKRLLAKEKRLFEDVEFKFVGSINKVSVWAFGAID